MLFNGKKYPNTFTGDNLGSSDINISKQISKLEKAGKIKKIAPRLYTSNLESSPEEIVQRNLFAILGKLFPDALLSHRSY